MAQKRGKTEKMNPKEDRPAREFDMDSFDLDMSLDLDDSMSLTSILADYGGGSKSRTRDFEGFRFEDMEEENVQEASQSLPEEPSRTEELLDIASDEEPSFADAALPEKGEVNDRTVFSPVKVALGKRKKKFRSLSKASAEPTMAVAEAPEEEQALPREDSSDPFTIEETLLEYTASASDDSVPKDFGAENGSKDAVANDEDDYTGFLYPRAAKKEQPAEVIEEKMPNAFWEEFSMEETIEEAPEQESQPVWEDVSFEKEPEEIFEADGSGDEVITPAFLQEETAFTMQEASEESAEEFAEESEDGWTQIADENSEEEVLDGSISTEAKSFADSLFANGAEEKAEDENAAAEEKQEVLEESSAQEEPEVLEETDGETDEDFDGEEESLEAEEFDQMSREIERVAESNVVFANFSQNSLAPDRPEIAYNEAEVLEPEYEEYEEGNGLGAFLSGLLHKKKAVQEKDEGIEEVEDAEEPDYSYEASLCGKKLNSLALRSTGVLILCLLMGLITVIFEVGGSLPFGMSHLAKCAGILGIMNLAVAALAIDIVIDGATDCIKGRPGIETLATLSMLISTIDVITVLAGKDPQRGLPLCVISAFALHISMRGRIQYRLALRDSLRLPAAVASPNTVVSTDILGDERQILHRTVGYFKGYYRNLTGADLSERVYSILSPLLILLSLIFSVATTLLKGEGESFTFAFSAFLAISTSYAGIIAYSKPFSNVTRKLRRMGIAIAGWCGAENIDKSDGTLVTDSDVFPAGTASVYGIKLFNGAALETAVVYTSSLILASGSSLSRAFSDLLASQALTADQVGDFACYEGGGLSANVRGSEVFVGSAAFMNLMGIRVPDNISVNNAIYTAIGGKLASVISIEYSPINSVQTALISLMRGGVNMLFAMRDFNITPKLLQQKFKVSLEDIEYVPAEISFRVTEEGAAEGGEVSAILCREGLGQMSDAVHAGKKLVLAIRLNTLLACLSSGIGLLFMLIVCAQKSFAAIACWRLLLFQIIVWFIALGISSIVKRKK